jgi:hypothetical protein
MFARMPRALGVGLAIALAAPGVHAEPGATQIDPTHFRREDAQRIHEQHRDLDREPAPVVPALASTASLAREPPAPVVAAPDRTRHTAGIVLLGIAGVSGLATVPFLDRPSRDGSDDAVVGVLLATAVIAGLAGGLLLSSSASQSPSRSIVLAPSVTPSSLGLVLVGRL